MRLIACERLYENVMLRKTMKYYVSNDSFHDQYERSGTQYLRAYILSLTSSL